MAAFVLEKSAGRMATLVGVGKQIGNYGNFGGRTAGWQDGRLS